MELRFSDAEWAFQLEVRGCIEGALPADIRQITDKGQHFTKEHYLRWHTILHEKGWSVPGWPEEFGGPGWTATQKYIFDLEMGVAGVPMPVPFGPVMVGPVIIEFGDEAQKKKYLPGIESGADWWCQGYSEPGSGSDLVSLQTFGEDKGDHWLVNGQKIWTSYADKADWIFCLVRTDKDNKYQGITFMLYDMASAGVSTKPILLISGNSPFCETFFDDVEVPKSYGENIPAQVGEVNRGWDVAKYLLGHEREMISNTGGNDRAGSFGKAVLPSFGADAMGRLDDPLLRAKIAELDVDALAFKAMAERFMDTLKAGTAHPAQPNMMKYAGTELNKRRNEIVMSAGGSNALEWESEASNGGARARGWLRTKANSIEGGTSEVMLNVISKRILELPDG